MGARRAAWLAAVLGVGLGVPAGGVDGQRPGPAPAVELEGSADVAIDRRLDQLLEEGVLVVSEDLRVAEGDTLAGPVLLLDATLILEGVVTGDLVVVDAGAFVRPTAEVLGDLVNAGGGLYRSELARVGGRILDLPTAPYTVRREEGRLVIEAGTPPSPLELDGVKGIRIPTYDRVNGATLALGARYHMPRVGEVAPSIHGWAGWQTERGEPTYGASLELRYGAMALAGGYDRGWVTNDDWIRSDLTNSLNYIWDGDDFRDYHEAERGWLELRRQLGDEEKRFHGRISVGAQVEDATSLVGGDPWHLLGDPARPNPEIDEGRTTSVGARLEVEWRGRETEFDGGVEYEAGREWLDGLFDFDLVAVRGDWAMHALADHTLEIEIFGQHPLGGSPPRQRWSFVGGSGTLQTLELAQHYGDRVVFVETRYIVPFPERVALPLLGAPDLELIHAAGMAWQESDEDVSLEQEVGARLQFFAAFLRYMVNPSAAGDGQLDVGVGWPFEGSYPWEKR